jgi:hypothetical protein
MARRRRRSRSGFKPGTLFAWVGAFIAVSALVIAGASLAKLRVERAGRDDETLCAKKTPDTITAILFDSSDRLSALQQIKIKQILEETLNTLPKGARLDVYMATAEAGQLVRPLFSKCNPSALEGSAGLSENPQRMLALRNDAFDQPLHAALQKALQANVRKTSPILETIAAASVQSFGVARSADKGKMNRHSLIIVSDFLQNSAVLTHYKAYPTIEQFSSQEGWISTKPSIGNVNIKLIYINRANSIRFQGAAHREWWCSYFNARGANKCIIEQL